MPVKWVGSCRAKQAGFSNNWLIFLKLPRNWLGLFEKKTCLRPVTPFCYSGSGEKIWFLTLTRMISSTGSATHRSWNSGIGTALDGTHYGLSAAAAPLSCYWNCLRHSPIPPSLLFLQIPKKHFQLFISCTAEREREGEIKEGSRDRQSMCEKYLLKRWAKGSATQKEYLQWENLSSDVFNNGINTLIRLQSKLPNAPSSKVWLYQCTLNVYEREELCQMTF